MRSTRIMTATAVIIVGVVFVHAQIRQSPNILYQDGGYQLSYGDTVEIQVFGEPEAMANGKINRDGGVRLVYLSGEIPIVGLTTKQAEEFISKQYFDQRIYRKALVRVTITKYTDKIVLFTGKFAKTGPFKFPPEVEAMDIVEVITRNGGFQDIAKTAEVKVIRTVHDKNGGSTKETYTVDVKTRMEGNTPQKSFMIYPGDTLFVREKLI